MLGFAPRIDYDFRLKFSNNYLSFSGITNGFPAYEVYNMSKVNNWYSRIYDYVPSSILDIVKLSDLVGNFTDQIAHETTNALK